MAGRNTQLLLESRLSKGSDVAPACIQLLPVERSVPWAVERCTNDATSQAGETGRCCQQLLTIALKVVPGEEFLFPPPAQYSTNSLNSSGVVVHQFDRKYAEHTTPFFWSPPTPIFLCICNATKSLCTTYIHIRCRGLVGSGPYSTANFRRFSTRNSENRRESAFWSLSPRNET